MILVVGATGQLGTAVVRRLEREGRPVRALVRRGSAFEHLRGGGVELAFGDLRDRESLDAACQGAAAVIATASVVFPSGRYDFAEDEGRGYDNLIGAARGARVGRFVFMSNAAPPYRNIPTLRYKRLIERRIRDSGIDYAIFRGAPFMDDYFALIGSAIPLRGAEAATLKRPFWFSRRFVTVAGDLIDRHGVAMVPGSPAMRHAFIALEDVADFLVRGADRDEARNRTIPIGGPDLLSWREVTELYSALLHKRIRVLSSPSWTSALGALALRSFSPAAANQLALLWVIANHETIVDSHAPARELGVELKPARRFLAERVALAG